MLRRGERKVVTLPPEDREASRRDNHRPSPQGLDPPLARVTAAQRAISECGGANPDDRRGRHRTKRPWADPATRLAAALPTVFVAAEAMFEPPQLHL
jgi:hypothetical protein